MTVYRLDGAQRACGESTGTFAALAFYVAERLARLRTAIRNRRSVKQLVTWDDRMLNDIGLTRGDVVSAMSGSIGDDPGYRLSALARERRHAERAAARQRFDALVRRRGRSRLRETHK